MAKSILNHFSTKVIKRYIVLLALFFLFSKANAYRLKDDDVIVVNGVIVSCIYDISTKGNVIEIPDVLDGQTITGIGDYAFSVAGKIAELILPSTLKTIGYGVFEGHALTSLKIPAGVTSIGTRAFFGNALSSINLPVGLETISEGAFGNNQLTGITLPDGIKSVGNYAFQNNQIASLTLPDGLKFIGEYAFQNNKIASLSIPKSVETMGSGAFAGNRIAELQFQAGSQIKEISGYCFDSNNIKTLNIPNSVMAINEGAFQNNPSLTSVTFSTNLLKIRQGAFNSCNLSSVNLPASLVFIGKYVFGNNPNLFEFNLPLSAAKYQWNESNGAKHNDGSKVTNIYNSFVAIIPYTLQDADVVVENGVITSCSYFNNPANLGSVITIPSKLDGQNITGIGGSVFYNRGISEVVLPEGLVNIEGGAFYYNEIINLSIPNTVVYIGESAFGQNCINTLNFVQNSQVEFIGRWAFSQNRLINIDFPKSVVKIEKYAFESNFLQKINFEQNSRLLSIGSRAFANNWQLLKFTLPDPIVSGNIHWVDWDDNKYSSNLEVSNFESFYKIPVKYTLTDDDVVVENGIIIKYTPANKFANLLTIPDKLDGQTITGIAPSVFHNTGLIGVDLPSTIKKIDYNAFAENEILRIKIPASVELINGSAFNSNNITELIFEDKSKLKQIEWGAFHNNKISTLTLPDQVNYIGSDAFSFNRISNTITIPDSVAQIGWYAFAYNSIPQLIIGKNSVLNSIGNYSFAYNQISNEIFIPARLTVVSDYAFLSNNISMVITHKNIVEYGNGAFLNNNPDLKIVLHEPPTIPKVTHFFWWKDNDDNHFLPGTAIPDFSKRYKAVIDQFFVVKFIITDNNNDPIENATIEFYDNSLKTDINGIDSIGPVYRGNQNYKVSAIGCYGVNGSVDVQDDMTVLVTLIRYYNVNITVVDINNNPISDAGIKINGAALTSGSNGTTSINLRNGDYPIITSAVGYRESTTPLTILDSGKDITVILEHVVVNYFPNGGVGAPFSETTTIVNYKTVGNSYSKLAYNFSHWNTESDNSGSTYAENATIYLGYANIDLYAIWTPVDYNIIYHLEGGQNDPINPKKYNIESEINLLPASKPTLYFATWLDANKNRVDKIEKGNTGDIELWAVFTAEPTYYIDYFNLENATHKNQSSYTKFDLPMLFTNANKRGYDFTGWYEDALLAKKIISIPDGSKKNYDIYAKWGNAVEYAINYNLAGGTNNPANPAKYSIESDKIIFISPAKKGANFVDWYSDKELTKKITGIPTGSIGDTTIYAKWDLAIFNIQYVLDGGKNNPANPTNYNIASSPINFEGPTKTGAKFIDWYSDKEKTKKIIGIPPGSIGDTTIYAKWELISFDIQYVLNGGNNNPVNPAKYTIESDNILFKSPSKLGAKFIAWYNDNDFKNKITEIPKGSVGDTSIYAKWELDTFNIQYILNGGNNNPANPAKYTIESNTINLQKPDQSGFIFDGWFTNSNYSTRINSVPKGSVGDVIVYAKWIELFDVNFIITTDGKNPARDIDIVINNTQKQKSDFWGLADTIMPDGSSLKYSIEINGIIIDDGSVTVTGSDVTVKVDIVDCYIRWYDVLFCDNGKGLWTDFVWYKDDIRISDEQFFHNPGGIKDGKYRLVLTSVTGVEYIWEKEYKTNEYWEQRNEGGNYEMTLFPNPITRGRILYLALSEDNNLQTSSIFIYGANGALTSTINNPLYMNEINIDSNFSSGVYHVILLDEKNKRRTVKDFVVY